MTVLLESIDLLLLQLRVFLCMQGAYRLEIISARSERVWSTAYTFLVLQIPRFWGLLISVDMLQRGVNKQCVTNPAGEFHVSASQKRIVYLHHFVTYPH